MILKRPFALLLTGVLVLGFASAAFAQDTKIAFVNIAKVVEEAPQAEAATKTLEQEFSPRDKQLVSQQKEFKRLEDKLARDAAIMSETERSKLERDILSGKRRLKNSQDEFRADFNLRRNEELRKLQKLVSEVIQNLGRQEKFDLILTEGIVFYSERIDITSKVLEQLQTKFRASGGK